MINKFLLLLFLWPILTFGQYYNIEKFEAAANKPAYVYDFAQDSLGRMFIASNQGLLKFDGISFVNLTPNITPEQGFVENIFCDSKNRIWYNHYQGGAAAFVNDINFPLPTEDYISGFVENKLGHVTWLNGTKAGSTGKSEDVLLLNDANTLVKTGESNYLKESSSGELELIGPAYNTLKSFSDYSLFAAEMNGDHFAIAGHNSLRIFASNSGEKLLEIPLNKISQDKIVTISFRHNKVFLSNSKSVIIEISFVNSYKEYKITQLNLFDETSNIVVRKTYLDLQGNLWIGTNGQGLFKLPLFRLRTLFLEEDNNTSEILCVESDNTRIYVGTDEGLFTYDLNDDCKLIDIKLPTKKITSIHKHHSDLWIGTLESGIYQLKNGVITQKTLGEEGSRPQTVNHISSKNDLLYIGTNSGLFIVNLLTNQETHLSTYDGLAHNIISFFLVDSKDRIWMDSPNSPIYCYDNEEMTYYSEIENFDSHNINSIVEDSEGAIWFSTEGNGLLKFENEKFTNIAGTENLIDDRPFGLCINAENQIVSFHNKGISILENNESQKWIQYHIEDLTDLRTTPEIDFANEYYLLKTDKNVAFIPIKLNRATIQKPSLFISNIVINDKIYDSQDQIELKHGKYFVTFNYECAGLVNSTHFSFNYKLEGFDKEWTRIDIKQRAIYYQSLTTGDYTFLIKITKNDQSISETEKIHFIIHPPFWQTSAFFILLIIGLIIFFLITIFTVNRLNKKKRQELEIKVQERTEVISQQNNEIKAYNSDLEVLSEKYLQEKETAERITNEVQESIQYAKNIQKAFLNNKDYIEWMGNFADGFIIYKPKDIVSGDYFWGYNKGKHLYLAVGDCTGHGVPGALISVFGVTLLKEILLDLTETDEILNKLRSRIIEELRQGDDEFLNDGMDMTMTRINIEERTLQISAANNPLYIIRSKKKESCENLTLMAETQELNLFKTDCDKMPVGYHFQMDPFTKQEIQLYKDDQLYLLSDGFPDQFGGEKFKKFSRRRMFKLMLEINTLSGKEQKKQLWNTLTEWMSEEDQIDDITLAGVKIK